MRQLHVLVWTAAGLCASCGDGESSSGGDCSALVACGGDVVGAWQVEQTCLAQTEVAKGFESALPAECSGSLTAAEAIPVNLQISYAADGTWATAGGARNHIEYTLTSDCLLAISASFPALSDALCSRIGESTQAQITLQDPEGTASCSFVNGGCDCQNTFELESSAQGTYRLDDNRVVIEDTEFPYCVSGDRMEYGDGTLGKSIARRH